MDFQKILEGLADDGLRRRLRVVQERIGGELTIEGRPLIDFCSNDYLGLATDPRLGEAAEQAIRGWGWGGRAAPLISGETTAHEGLRSTLADFFGASGTLLFNSGYQANVGAIPVLVGEGGEIFSDELNHASLIDGCRLAKVPVTVFQHRDVGHLESLLQKSSSKKEKWIVTESLFSMDGDRAPLKELADLASRYGASLYIDEAHALGTCGPEGKGLWEECRQKNPDVLSEEAVVRLGTLGKAFGSFGAFVLSGTTVTEFLMNRARSFIFTTALPPAVVAASQKGVELAAAEPALRERLWKNVARLASGLDQPITAPISPFLYPGNKPVMAAAKKLFEAGLYVQGIRSPTVPAGKERLRITISTHHTEAQIDKLAEVLKGL